MYAKKYHIQLIAVLLGLSSFVLSSCVNPQLDTKQSKMIVSVKDQQMLLTQFGKPVKSYKVSTSKFGLGDIPNSMRTPLGVMKVARKFGEGHPAGAVFKSRQPTGEVLEPNAPGRDPIVTRILWLEGTERRNKNAFGRYIYIHGTPEEKRIGEAASYGCIRMTSEDIIDLYSRVGVNAQVEVIRRPLVSTFVGLEHKLANRLEKQELPLDSEEDA